MLTYQAVIELPYCGLDKGGDRIDIILYACAAVIHLPKAIK
jgi:hypothetical protein